MSMKSILFLMILSVLMSCATGHQNTSEKIRALALAGNFEGAITYLKASPLALEERSKLLYFTELGLLEHYRGNLVESNVALTTAKDLIEELYTTRVSGKISSFVSNDNADLYYGEKYEASLVYFYLALNNYTLATKEVDEAKKKEYLHKARAEVVGWDSFLTEMKQERLGQALFKEDLLAKTFGAFIHEIQNTSQDDQIALQLYKDAKQVFFKNYNLYPTYNQAYEDFRTNFGSFGGQAVEEIAGKYVRATSHNHALTQFLDEKITRLGQKMKKKPSATEGSITFLLQDGMIAAKVPEVHTFPAVWGAHQSMASTFSMGQHIQFELPTLSRGPNLESSQIQALDATGAVQAQGPFSVVAPLSELAEQAVVEHSKSIAAKTAARIITKHIAAIVASSAAYENGRRNNNSFIMLLAIAGHAGSTAAINASEKADVRFWSTLPSNIRMSNLVLKKGSYQFRAVFGDPAAPSRIVDLGTHEVGPTFNTLVQTRIHGATPVPAVAVNVPVATTPGSVSLMGGVGREVSGAPASCMNDQECGTGKVCATLKGVYPGSCAAK